MYNKVQAGQIALKFIDKHKIEVLAFVAIIDNIRVRFAKAKDRKRFEENSIKTQKIFQKQNAEINILKEKAEQAAESIKKVEQLEQIVEKITEEDF